MHKIGGAGLKASVCLSKSDTSLYECFKHVIICIQNSYLHSPLFSYETLKAYIWCKSSWRWPKVKFGYCICNSLIQGEIMLILGNWGHLIGLWDRILIQHTGIYYYSFFWIYNISYTFDWTPIYFVLKWIYSNIIIFLFLFHSIYGAYLIMICQSTFCQIPIVIYELEHYMFVNVI